MPQEREDKQRRLEEKHQREVARQERQSLGLTSGGHLLDMAALAQLCALDVAKPLAVQALKITDNDTSAAVDMVTNPHTKLNMQMDMLLEATKKVSQNRQEVMRNLVVAEAVYAAISGGKPGAVGASTGEDEQK